MDDKIVGYNRSVITKEQVIHGYALLNRWEYVTDYIVAFSYIVGISFSLVIFQNVDASLQILIITIGFSMLLVYIISRLQRILLRKRAIESQFSINNEATLHYTFRHKRLDVDIAINDRQRSYALDYREIDYVYYDDEIVVLKNKEEQKVFWFNPLFLKDISLNQFLEMIKVTNPKVKIVGIMQ